MKKLPIDKIRRDGGTQTRAALDFDTIEDYAELMEAGTKFPPVVVFYDGTEYWLADGFHRVNGAETCGIKDIECDVKQGTQRDAILYSVGANAANGLRRTNADKRRAVETLLNDEKWAKWSDREIAKRCSVSAPLVAQLREVVTVNSYSEKSYRTKHGTEAVMNTENIGKPRRQQEEAADEEIEIDLPKDPEFGRKMVESLEAPTTELQRLRLVEFHARSLYEKLAKLPLAKQLPEFEALGSALAKVS